MPAAYSYDLRKKAIYCKPWSLCSSRFLTGLRLLMAINKEFITNCLFIALLINYHT
ncbi:hypothetical protein [Wolbachia endosymbiont (group A) of Ischnus inquisitorius]|uniref:hypothetical protein n=1 Tax=Wolbachia endosymbiont (group A) of Ischnus inquisitorius TaxID=3077922 RepID=UPI00313321A1